MTERTIELGELEQLELGDVLREVVEREETLTIQLPGGEAVTIQRSQRLKPLPVLDGYVPEGWKDAINGPDERAATRPCPRLEPLPKLKCIVPRDWRERLNRPAK